MSSPMAFFAAMAAALVASLLRDGRRLLVPIPAITLFGLWITVGPVGSAAGKRSLPSPLDLVTGTADVLDSAVVRLFGDFAFHGTYLVVVGLIVFRLLKQRLDALDAALMLTAAAYIASVIYARVENGLGSTEDGRFGVAVAVFLLPVLVRYLPVPQRVPLRVLGIAAVLVVVATNADRQLDFEQRMSDIATNRRGTAEVATAVVAAGEPVVESKRIEIDALGPFIDVGALRALVDDGFPTSMEWPDALVSSTRAQLRMQAWPAGQIAGEPPTSSEPVDDDGCLGVSADESAELTVDAPGVILIRGDPDDDVRLTWSDALGSSEMTISHRFWDHPAFPGRSAVHLADPRGTATVEIGSEMGGVVVCGLVGQSMPN